MSDAGQRKSPGNGAGQASSADSNGGSEANEATIERLFHAHHRALVRRARRWVASHDAEDVVQEAFRSCWEEIDGEGIPGDIVARLHRRTSLRSLDLRRKLSHWESWDPAAFEALAPGLAPDALRKREILEWLIERVPELESKRLIDFLLRGMTHGEIAEAEKLPEGTVKWRIHALRKKLSILKNNSNPSAF